MTQLNNFIAILPPVRSLRNSPMWPSNKVVGIPGKDISRNCRVQKSESFFFLHYIWNECM